MPFYFLVLEYGYTKLIFTKGILKMAIINVTTANFKEIISGEKPVLLDFYADWCGPCQMVAPIVHEIADARADIVVGKINVDEEAPLAIQFGVSSIPTLIVIKNGEQTAKSVGLRSKEQIIELINN